MRLVTDAYDVLIEGAIACISLLICLMIMYVVTSVVSTRFILFDVC